MRIAESRAAAWIAPGLFAAARLGWPPSAQNTHTLMYPLVEASGAYNTLEPFHPLYPPLVGLIRRAWEAAGGTGPALPALLFASLAAGCVHLVLVHRLVKRVSGDAGLALGAALIAAASANLWSWSLQTAAYNFATAALLGLACLLVERETLGVREAAWAGLLTGVAAGFDVAAALALPLAAAELLRRRKKGASSAAMLAALAGAAAVPMAVGAAALLLRFSSRGWPFPPSLGGFMDSLPEDIVPVWVSRDLLAQLGDYWRSDAPSDWPRLAPLLILAASRRPARGLGWRGAALWRLGAGLWTAITLFYFACDTHNRFAYAGGLLLPALLAAALAKRTQALAWCAGAAALLAASLALRPPRYAPERNPGLDEASFLASRLGPRDAILALSEPDWALAYGLGRRVAVVPLGAENERALAGRLCAGGAAVFAADSLFRSSARDPDELEREARSAVSRLSASFSISPAWVSPGGQHYLPLRPRRCARGI